MQQRILGIAAAMLLVGALAVWLWWPTADGTLAFCWRAGALFAVAWLAYEDVQRLPGWLLVGLPAGLIILVRWPKLLVPVIPLLIVCEVLRRGLRK